MSKREQNAMTDRKTPEPLPDRAAAGLASFFLPGLGQVAQGRIDLGLLFVAGDLFAWLMAILALIGKDIPLLVALAPAAVSIASAFSAAGWTAERAAAEAERAAMQAKREAEEDFQQEARAQTAEQERARVASNRDQRETKERET